VDNLSSNCLIAWKDMQRAGIISPSFPAKVHLTKVILADCRVSKQIMLADCRVNKQIMLADCCVNKQIMPLCALLDVKVKRVNATDMPKCSVPSSKCVNVTDRSDSLVISPNMVKQTVTASAVDQSKGSCLKQNLTDDPLDSLMKEFKDVFEADKITPLAGASMQVHLKQDDPSYRPIRVSHHRKVPLHFQEEADKTLKWFLDSGVIVPVPPTENVEWVSPGFFVAKPNGKVRLVTDLKAINQFVIWPCHPFPSPRDVVRNIKTDFK
jgi:hypothetical protein